MSDDDVRAAVVGATSWAEAASVLGVDDAHAIARVKGHAARLGLELEGRQAPPTPREFGDAPDLDYLDRAGSLLAAAWFSMAGYEVSWPLEPSRYDLLIAGNRRIDRVQVKTTRTRAGNTWKVYLSTSRGRRTYTPDEIDSFFVIDGDFCLYLIPVAVVGGLQAIHLARYRRYRLGRLAPEATVS